VAAGLLDGEEERARQAVHEALRLAIEEYVPGEQILHV